MANLSPVRQFTGWIIRPYFRRRHETALTHLDVDEELWLAIRHPAEFRASALICFASTIRTHVPRQVMS